MEKKGSRKEGTTRVKRLENRGKRRVKDKREKEWMENGKWKGDGRWLRRKRWWNGWKKGVEEGRANQALTVEVEV